MEKLYDGRTSVWLGLHSSIHRESTATQHNAKALIPTIGVFFFSININTHELSLNQKVNIKRQYESTIYNESLNHQLPYKLKPYLSLGFLLKRTANMHISNRKHVSTSPIIPKAFILYLLIRKTIKQSSTSCWKKQPICIFGTENMSQ